MKVKIVCGEHSEKSYDKEIVSRWKTLREAKEAMKKIAAREGLKISVDTDIYHRKQRNWLRLNEGGKKTYFFERG